MYQRHARNQAAHRQFSGNYAPTGDEVARPVLLPRPTGGRPTVMTSSLSIAWRAGGAQLPWLLPRCCRWPGYAAKCPQL